MTEILFARKDLIGTGAALTAVNDTNVTATLSGNPAAALVAATTITFGWTGTLALSRLAQGTNGQLIIGQTGAASVYTTVSGDATLSAAGVFTIAASAVTYAKIQNVAASRLLGNPTGGAAAPSEISLGATLTFSGTALQTLALTGDVTTAANSFATTIAAGAVTFAKIASAAIATSAQWRSNTASLLLSTDQVWGAAALVTLVDAATVTPDFSTGFDFIWTLGAAGRTLANATNPKVGQKGVIYLVQDATGGRTITTWGTSYKFAGGVKPTLTTTANAVDVLSYVVKSATEYECFFTGNMS